MKAWQTIVRRTLSGCVNWADAADWRAGRLDASHASDESLRNMPAESTVPSQRSRTIAIRPSCTGYGRSRQRFTKELIAEALRPVDRRGGSHDADWRCPNCRHFSSIRQRACGTCREPGPLNGRLTRAALRERSIEHRIQSTLRKFGLSAE